MDKREACHKLAELNEEVYDLQISLERIESKIRLDDGDNRERYLSCKEEILAKKEIAQKEAESFLNKYYDIIHS